jgi:hypothetical protein
LASPCKQSDNQDEEEGVNSIHGALNILQGCCHFNGQNGLSFILFDPTRFVGTIVNELKIKS